jgi:hypothetical protein
MARHTQRGRSAGRPLGWFARLSKWWLVALGLVLVAVILASGYLWSRGRQATSAISTPDLAATKLAEPELATTRLTAQNIYRVTILPEGSTVPINEIHTWVLRVQMPDGQPVADATITINGDMPEHGHGLPTEPKVTRYLGSGEYLIEGMKFQMPGAWVVDFAISAGGHNDTVKFNLSLT